MQTLVAEIVAAWRRADRLTVMFPEGTPNHLAAVTAAEKLRELFQDLTLAVEPSSVDVADALKLLDEFDDMPPPGGRSTLS